MANGTDLAALMDDFKGFSTIVTLNMILDMKFPKVVERDSAVDQLVDSWALGVKQQFQREAPVIVDPEVEAKATANRQRWMDSIDETTAEIKRILKGHPKK